MFIIVLFLIISSGDFRVLPSGIIADRSIWTGFCNVICSLVCDMCTNIFDAWSSNNCLLVCRNMVGGRNRQAIIDALEAMDQALQGQQNQAGDEFCGLGKFRRNNSLTFKGIYDPEGGQTWLGEIDKIFWVMACTKDQKVLFGTHMLSEEARDRWDNVRQGMEDEGTEVLGLCSELIFQRSIFQRTCVVRKSSSSFAWNKGIRQLLSMLLSLKSWWNFV